MTIGGPMTLAAARIGQHVVLRDPQGRRLVVRVMARCDHACEVFIPPYGASMTLPLETACESLPQWLEDDYAEETR